MLDLCSLLLVVFALQLFHSFLPSLIFNGEIMFTDLQNTTVY